MGHRQPESSRQLTGRFERRRHVEGRLQRPNAAPCAAFEAPLCAEPAPNSQALALGAWGCGSYTGRMVGHRSHRVCLSLLALVGLLRAEPAQACGASPTPRYTVLDMSPLSTDAPLNAPIVLRLGKNVTDSDAPPLTPSLYLRASTSDETTAVSASSLGLGSDGELSFVPEANLPPNTTFAATFHTGQETASADQPAGTTWSFRTGSETAPGLSLEGALSVTLEPGEDNALECPNNCGCTATGPAFAVTKARVKLPRLVGGFPTQRAELWLTDNAPATFLAPHDIGSGSRMVQLGGQLRPEELEAGEAVWTVPEEETPYKPCFAFQAFDARGDVAQAQSLCLDEYFPSVTQSGGLGTAGSTGATSSKDRADTHTSSACSFAPAARGFQAWLPALLLLGGFSRRWRSRARRRPSRRPARRSGILRE